MKKDKAKTAAIIAAPIIGAGILGNILLGGGESISEPNETKEQIVETSGESENTFSETVPETMSELYNPFEEESEPTVPTETEAETELYVPPETEPETEPYIPTETEPETEPYIPPETNSETEPYIPPETESETEPYIPPETESETTTPVGEEMQWIWGSTASEAETFSETEYYSEPETYAEPEPFTETELYSEPETETTITITHSDSSMTDERISELVNAAFFWAPSGNKVHIDPDCRTFQKGYTFAGTIEQAESVRTDGFCGICSKSATRTENSHATVYNLADCYTYEDFINGIPAEAFE